jgi:2-dehydropantoate 2-reductase
MKTKIVIVGLGGVGGYYGGLLAKHYANDPAIEICFFARGEHLNLVQENGLTVITETETFIAHPSLATDNIFEIGKADYVIMTTKSYDLESTILQIKPCIDEKTVILPLLNGADISSRIRKSVPQNEVWDGCVYIVGRLNEPGVVESSGGVHDLFFGAENGSKDRLNFMEKVMKVAGIKVSLREDIRMVIWRKFIFISVTASLTSYFNVGFRDLLTDEERRKTTMAFLSEVTNVAKAEGIHFDFDIVDTTIRHIERLPFETTSSMHSDFKAGRNAEIETLTNIVIQLGKQYGVETPFYEKVYESLKLRMMK